jgi:hypothetical protein
MVGGIAMLDYRAAQDTKPLRPARDARRKLFPNRSGYPRGLEGARGVAKQIAAHTNKQIAIAKPLLNT